MKNNNELMLDVGQANEIKLALRREGLWTNEEIKMLCERKGFLTQVHEVLLGHAEIKMIEHLVDCSLVPSIKHGFAILPNGEQLPNRVQGFYRLDVSKIKLHSSKKQKGIDGNEIKKELENAFVLPANVIDFLLKEENQNLIPEEWKGKAVFFWGTIYKCTDGDDSLYVRLIHWSLGKWDSEYEWIGNRWSEKALAAIAVFAS